MTSKQQDTVSARAPLSDNLRRSEAKAKAKGRIVLPYLKFSGRRLENGRREWALSWRALRPADLRNIWNGAKSLDKKRAAPGVHRRASKRTLSRRTAP